MNLSKLTLLAFLAASATAAQAATAPLTICEFWQPDEIDYPNGATSCIYNYTPAAVSGGLTYVDRGPFRPVEDRPFENERIDTVHMEIRASGKDSKPFAGRTVNLQEAIPLDPKAPSGSSGISFSFISNSGVEAFLFIYTESFLEPHRFSIEFDDNQNVASWAASFIHPYYGFDDRSEYSSTSDFKDYYDDQTLGDFALFYTNEPGIWSEQPAQVPLPATGLLLLGGLGMMSFRRYLKNKS